MLSPQRPQRVADPQTAIEQQQRQHPGPCLNPSLGATCCQPLNLFVREGLDRFGRVLEQLDPETLRDVPLFVEPR